MKGIIKELYYGYFYFSGPLGDCKIVRDSRNVDLYQIRVNEAAKTFSHVETIRDHLIRIANERNTIDKE